MQKGLAVLGATGSIGSQTLDIVQRLGQGHIKVHHMVAFRDSASLRDLARVFPMATTSAVATDGLQVLVDAVMDPAVDTVVVAVSGAAALDATLAACRRGLRVCIATKEVLVAAGALVMDTARQHGATILPIDSEHSALFQCIQGYNRSDIERMHLTASGGPFRLWDSADIQSATIEQALNHPTWKMGGKITIDSASMMNKGLEIIEACRLYDLPESQVDVVVHPQSIIHSMVEFVDGSQLAQLGYPDMRLPIQIALMHPEKVHSGIPRLSPAEMGTLEFYPVNHEKFPAMELARQAFRKGYTVPAVMNAANEAVVAAFLNGKCSFGAMHNIILDTMNAIPIMDEYQLSDIVLADTLARGFVNKILEKHSGTA